MLNFSIIPETSITSNTNKFHLLRDKICRFNEKISLPKDMKVAPKMIEKSDQHQEFSTVGVQNCCITTHFPNKREKGLLK